MAHAAQVTDHLLDILKSINAKHILDVGCGSGGLARLLTSHGYQVNGIDPQEDQITKAQSTCPDGIFTTSGAEDIPADDSSLDAVVVLNAFHHVPPALMEKALGECHRVLKPLGELIIIEPLAHGSFFEAMRPLEDETEIRNHAREVIEAASKEPDWQQISCTEVERTSTFEDTDAFIDMVIGVDPARAQAAIDKRDEINTLFEKYAKNLGAHFELVQPHIIWRLKPRALARS